MDRFFERLHFLGRVVPVVEFSINVPLLGEGITCPDPDGDVPLENAGGAAGGALGEDMLNGPGTVPLLGMDTTGRAGMGGLELAVLLAGMVWFMRAGMGVGVASAKLEVDTMDMVVKFRAAVDEGNTKSEVLLDILLVVIEELCAVLVLLGFRHRCISLGFICSR